MSRASKEPEVVQVIVPPVSLEVDGCRVDILEVTDYTTLTGKKRYLVSCRAFCMGRASNTFFLDVESNEELKAKIRVEVAKFKLLARF